MYKLDQELGPKLTHLMIMKAYVGHRPHVALAKLSNTKLIFLLSKQLEKIECHDPFSHQVSILGRSFSVVNVPIMLNSDNRVWQER